LTKSTNFQVWSLGLDLYFQVWSLGLGIFDKVSVSKFYNRSIDLDQNEREQIGLKIPFMKTTKTLPDPTQHKLDFNLAARPIILYQFCESRSRNFQVSSWSWRLQVSVTACCL